MKQVLLFIVACSALWVKGAEDPSISMDLSTIGADQAQKARYLEDPENAYGIEDVLTNEELRFGSIDEKRKNFGFTTSAYWVRFELVNRMGSDRRFLLELSRSLTNRVKIFRTEGNEVVDSALSGDHVPYHQKPFPHRKPIFPVHLEKGERATFYARMEQEGEALIVPLKVWTPRAFESFDRKERLPLGIFYGVLLFVVLIFAFFYFTLRDRSFLYYTLYVLSFAFLQFALDGFAHRYFFPKDPYMADRAVLSTSFIVVIFVTLYARSFLRMGRRSPPLNRVFRFLIGVGVIGLFVSFTNGRLYSLSYPFVNMLSFGGPLFILGSILYLRTKGYRVSPWFLVAFILLIVGVISFLLGNTGVVTPNFFTINGLKLGSMGEVIFLSFTMVEKYRELQREKEEERQNSLERLMELNRLKDEYNKELEEKVETRTEELRKEREKLEETNQEIMSSIRYAQRIQEAILPPDRAIEPFFNDHLIVFRPRDLVSGDIYWFASVTTTTGNEGSSISREITKDMIPERSELTVFSVMDCTGHGVPGAFLSILGHDTLNRTLKEPTVNSPGEALQFVDRAVRSTFSNAYGPDEKIEDGMDMGMCAIDHEGGHLYFAGANHPCYIVREGEVHELKGDKKGVGGSDQQEEKRFSTHTFPLQEGDAIYLFSDGYPDQFGGAKGKKFKYKAFKKMLSEIHDQDMDEQKRILEERFDRWKGDLDQVDDVLVVGVRV